LNLLEIPLGAVHLVVRQGAHRRKYLAHPGFEHSFTASPLKARMFSSREAAASKCCPENEVPVPLSTLFS
jgi:hypothetical protein